MSDINKLESTINDFVTKSTPALPENGKKFIVTYLPWLTLFLGVVYLYYAWTFYQAVHVINNLYNYANSFSYAYGIKPVVPHSTGVGITSWIEIILLVVVAIMFLAAFPGIKAKKKSGWNLLYYAFLLNIIYSVISVFTNYGIGGTIFGIIAVVIGLYFLFQIRSSYVKGSAAPKA